MKNLSRRDFLKVAGATTVGTAAVLTLAACGNGGGGGTTQEVQETTTGSGSVDVTAKVDDLAASADVKTGIIDKHIFGNNFSCATLTPFRNTQGQHALLIKYVYDRLCYLGGDYRFTPQAAKSITPSDDGITYDVEIYDYITDSAGNNITADDVVWFINEYRQNGLKKQFLKIDSVEKTGDYSLRIVMTDDIADIVDMIFASTFMVAQSEYEKSSDGMATNPVTTSPYKVTNFVSASSCTLELRDDYWMTEEQMKNNYFQANVRHLEMLTITEASQMQIALETGAVDSYPGINSTVVKSFEDNDDYIVTKAPSNNAELLFFSGDSHSPCAEDENLRKAIVYAINVDAVIKGAMDGYAEPMHDFTCRTGSGYVDAWESEEYFGYDPAKAKEFLDASDYKGETLTYALVTKNKKMGEILVNMWAAVGINVQLDVRDGGTFSSVGPADFDLYTTSTGNGVANMWSQYFDGNSFDYGGKKGDRMGRNDEELTEMIYYAWKVPNYTPENIDKVQKYIKEKCYVFGIALSQVTNVARKSSGIVGTTYNYQGQLDIASCSYQVE